MERGPGVAHQILKHGLVGKPDEIAEKLREYKNAGVDQFLHFKILLTMKH